MTEGTESQAVPRNSTFGSKEEARASKTRTLLYRKHRVPHTTLEPYDLFSRACEARWQVNLARVWRD